MHPALLLASLLPVFSLGQAFFAFGTVAICVGWLITNSDKLAKLWGMITAGRKAKDEEVNRRLDRLEGAKYVPGEDIEEGRRKLGVEIADNQAKIKAYHDAAEASINALVMRTQALEQHNVNLTLLPMEVNNLKTNHAVLASKVDDLGNKIADLSRQQNEHFRDLMEAMNKLSFTRGQLAGGQRQPPYELPSS